MVRSVKTDADGKNWLYLGMQIDKKRYTGYMKEESVIRLDVYKRQTYTRQVAKLLEGSNVTLLDTRKTTPNCRVFEKYAVRVGGGCNHRYNLSDGVLLKDNHIGAAGRVTKAVQMAKAYAPFVRKIEIEIETLDQVKDCLLYTSRCV